MRARICVRSVAELLAHHGAPALGDVAPHVRQRDRETLRRRQLSDPTSHLAGADDTDAVDAVQD